MLSITVNALKAVAKAASKDLGRYAINGVHVTKAGVAEATDGHVLLRAKGNSDGELQDSILEAKSLALALQDKYVKKIGEARIQANGTVSMMGKDGPLAVTKVENAEFPATENVFVIRSDENVLTVGFGARVLKILAEAALIADPADGLIRFQFQKTKDGGIDEQRGVRVDMGKGADAIEGVAMPMSL